MQEATIHKIWMETGKARTRMNWTKEARLKLTRKLDRWYMAPLVWVRISTEVVRANHGVVNNKSPSPKLLRYPNRCKGIERILLARTKEPLDPLPFNSTKVNRLVLSLETWTLLVKISLSIAQKLQLILTTMHTDSLVECQMTPSNEWTISWLSHRKWFMRHPHERRASRLCALQCPIKERLLRSKSSSNWPATITHTMRTEQLGANARSQFQIRQWLLEVARIKHPSRLAVNEI